MRQELDSQKRDMGGWDHCHTPAYTMKRLHVFFIILSSQAERWTSILCRDLITRYQVKVYSRQTVAIFTAHIRINIPPGVTIRLKSHRLFTANVRMTWHCHLTPLYWIRICWRICVTIGLARAVTLSRPDKVNTRMKHDGRQPRKQLDASSLWLAGTFCGETPCVSRSGWLNSYWNLSMRWSGGGAPPPECAYRGMWFYRFLYVFCGAHLKLMDDFWLV